MKLDAEFIRLPYRFDAQRMAQELAQFERAAWMAHPNGIAGNTALALISRDGGNNNDFRGQMVPTAHLQRCPYIQQVIASFDEVFGRSRVMRLGPGAEVTAHFDYNHHWHNHVRIHIPVVTNPQVSFHCGDAVVNMQAGDCWIFDSWRLHRVLNAGTDARMHLVIDTAGSARFWRIAEQALRARQAGEEMTPRFLAYDPAARPSIVTERFTLLPVMAPGEVDGLCRELSEDIRSESRNDRADCDRACNLMLDFCRDWRALWYRHGVHRAGWSRFRALIESTSRELSRSKVILRSNECPFTVVFAARVLDAALAPELFADLQESSALGGDPQATVKRVAPEPQPALRQESSLSTASESARNAPCHCGSGLRYKRCHGAP